MKHMNHNDLQDTYAAVLKQHPFLGFVICSVVAVGTALTSSDPNSWHFPLWIMQTGQWVAWLFAYAVGAITILNWLEKVFDFKLNLKQYFKRKTKK